MCVSLPGSAAALLRSEPCEPPGPRPARRGHAKRRPGRGLPGPRRRVELTAPFRASPGAAAGQSPAPRAPGAEESPAGLPLRPVPGCPHQHPQCPHRPRQEPGHEDQGSGQRGTHGEDRQEEMKARKPRAGPRHK